MRRVPTFSLPSSTVCYDVSLFPFLLHFLGPTVRAVMAYLQERGLQRHKKYMRKTAFNYIIRIPAGGLVRIETCRFFGATFRGARIFQSTTDRWRINRIFDNGLLKDGWKAVCIFLGGENTT